MQVKRRINKNHYISQKKSLITHHIDIIMITIIIRVWVFIVSITVYSKPACVQCVATQKALKAKGVSFTTVDLTQNNEAMDLVQSLGYRQAPVVVADNQHWSGFRPDMINRL